MCRQGGVHTFIGWWVEVHNGRMGGRQGGRGKKSVGQYGGWTHERGGESGEKGYPAREHERAGRASCRPLSQAFAALS